MRVLPINNTSNYKLTSFGINQDKKLKEEKRFPERLISSVDPKVLALAAAIATMSPACSNNKPENDNFSYETSQVEYGDSLKDIAFNRNTGEKRYIYYTVANLLLHDSAKVEKFDDNKFLGSITLKDKKVKISANFDSEDAFSVNGFAKVVDSNTKDKKAEVYEFDAKIEGFDDISVNVRDTLDKGKSFDKYIVHRNFDGKLYMINKVTNEVVELSQSPFEKIDEKYENMKKAQMVESVDDIRESLVKVVLLTFGLGLSTGLLLGNNKERNNDDSKNNSTEV